MPLAERSPSEARGELLEAARSFAARRRPGDLVAQWRNDPTVRPSGVDLRLSTALDALALDAAGDFDAVLLSPVAPLGSSSVVAPSSQDRTLTTMRSSEVVSDPTNVLALECARRLAADPTARVRLCTVHQTLRMQPQGRGRGLTQHFRLFALAEAGPGLPSDGFEVRAVVEHLGAYVHILRSAAASHDLVFDRPTAIVRTDDRYPSLAERLVERLAVELPEIAVRTEHLDSSYYAGLRVGFGVHSAGGEFFDIVDLGALDWVAQLTGNRKHRLIASAIGIQLLPLLARE